MDRVIKAVQAGLQGTDAEGDRVFYVLFETALDAMVIADDQGRYVAANPAACELFGLPQTELLDRSIADFTHPDIDLKQAWQEFQTQGQARGDFTLVRADGTVRLVEFAATANVVPHRHLSVIRDVTVKKQLEQQLHRLNQDLERQVAQRTAELEQANAQLHAVNQALEASQKKYQTLFEILPVGVSITDADGNLMEVNPASTQILGMSPEEQTQRALDASSWRVIHPDGSPMAVNDYASTQALREQRVIQGQEQGIVRPDGSIRWLTVSAAPIPLDDYGVAIAYLDVTEAKQTELALKHIEAQFLEISKSSPASIYILVMRVDGSFHFDYISQAIESIHEVSVEQALADADWVINAMHPDDRPGYTAAVEASLATLQPFQHEWRIITPSGVLKWLRGHSRPNRRDNGDVAWYGVVFDITDRKQLEQELNASREKLASILDSVQASIVKYRLFDDGTFVYDYYSPKCEVIFGYLPEELLKDSQLWRSRVLSEDLDTVIRPVLQAILDGQIQVRAAYRFRHRDGSIRWIQETATAHRHDTQDCWLVTAVATDISDRKQIESALRQQEQEFRTLAENTPDCILRCDRQFRFTYLNPAVVALTHLPISAMLGKTSEELGFPEPLVTLWHGAMAKVFATGQGQHLEYAMDLPVGSRYFYSRVVPEIDPGGDVTSVLAVIRDITDLKRAQDELLRQAEGEHTLRLITQHIRETLNLDDILSTAVTEIQRTLQADRTLIFKLNSDHAGVVIQEVVRPEYPTTLEMRWEDECFPPECYAAYAEGMARIVPDVTQDTWGACMAEFMQSIGVQSKMVAPILQGQNNSPGVQGQNSSSKRVWGLLITHACATPRQWQPEELDLLQQVAEQLAIALHQAELHQQLQTANQELERLSNTDSLTQIANRRYFDHNLAQEWQRAQREDRPLALLLCDIDFFKQYNDTYGHPAGDACLIAVAQALQGCLRRSSDCLARYGGEEFAIILPCTDRAGAEAVVRTMQQAIAALNLPHATHLTAQHITLSYGVATALPQAGLSPEDLVRRADQALYQAKQAGRDRACMAPELSPDQ